MYLLPFLGPKGAGCENKMLHCKDTSCQQLIPTTRGVPSTLAGSMLSRIKLPTGGGNRMAVILPEIMPELL